MKTIKYIITLYLSICTLVFSSCDNFLNELDPQTISATTYPTNLYETEVTLYSAYNSLFDVDVLTITRSAVSCDMGFPGSRSNDPSTTTLGQFYQHTYVNSAVAVEDKWSAHYTGVMRANQVIQYLNELDATYHNMDDWTLQMAQARYLRGLHHFFLASVYNEGNVIIFDCVPSSDDEYYQPLSKSEDVIEFYRADLLYAYSNLPLSYEDSADVYKVTKGAAATTLGLSYIYNDDFDTAEEYFKEVIESGVYTLATPDKLFTTQGDAGEFNSESILEINYQSGLKPTAATAQRTTHSLGQTSSTSLFTPPSWIVDEYQLEPVDPLYDDNYTTYPHCQFGDSYLRNVSYRGSAMIGLRIDEDTPYYLSEMTTTNIDSSLDKSLGYYKKYTYWDSVSSEGSGGDGSSRSGKNITINRLSEVYLLYAECMIIKGELYEALRYINRIRARWGLVLLGTVATGGGEYTSSERTYDGEVYDQQSLMEHLMYIEKPLELSAEGHFIRNIDLRRWGVYHDRYKSLSQQTYVTSKFNFYSLATRDSDSRSTSTNDGWLRKLEDLGSGESATASTVEYEKAAEYFTDSYLWWPIPLEEERTNNRLYEIVPKSI